jgi:hypothetical protein
MAFFHAASDHELLDLLPFQSTWAVITERLRDPTDIAGNWWLVGVEPCQGGRRAVLLERSSLAFAYVLGDGEHFGRVTAPEPNEVAGILERYGLHWD